MTRSNHNRKQHDLMRVLSCFGWCVFVLLASVNVRGEEPTKQPPNILIIMADDLGYSDLGCYGSEIETPTLDALAGHGLRYTQFYNTARCWPTRSSLLTGYYPQQLRADPPKGSHPTWATILPDYLKPKGYSCFHSGKWHIPGAPQPLKDGHFDHSYTLDDHDRNFYPKQARLDDKKLPAVERGSTYYSTTAITDHALKCLEEHSKAGKDRPFFSYIAYTVPHFPLHAQQADVERYLKKYAGESWPSLRQNRLARLNSLGISDGKGFYLPKLSDPEANVRAPSGRPNDADKLGSAEVFYAVDWNTLNEEQRSLQLTKLAIHAAMVDCMDREIGRVVQFLRESNQLDNTLIFFLADNGASAEILVRGDGHKMDAKPGSGESYLCLGPGGSTVCNTPFRRHKIWVYEGGISTPLIVHWPNGIAARGELRRQSGHVIDIVPTLLDVVGIDVGDRPVKLPGISLVASFKENKRQGRELYFNHSGNRALIIDDWKIVSSADNGDSWELYDLGKDRIESDNKAETNKTVLEQLASRWKELTEQFATEAGEP
jgi:arylsulfatase